MTRRRRNAVDHGDKRPESEPSMAGPTRLAGLEMIGGPAVNEDTASSFDQTSTDSVSSSPDLSKMPGAWPSSPPPSPPDSPVLTSSHDPPITVPDLSNMPGAYPLTPPQSPSPPNSPGFSPSQDRPNSTVDNVLGGVVKDEVDDW